MATTDELLRGATLASMDLRVASRKWRSFFVRPVISDTRIILDALITRFRSETSRLTSIAEQNESLDNRILLAIRECERNKGNGKYEDAFAIILSPSQFERLSWTHNALRKKTGTVTRFYDLPVYTAKGVYGPLVLTKDAFDGFSRQAPELMLKAV